MTPEKLALINLIARLGFDAALIVWKNIASAPTVDDAIAALEKSRGTSWDDYKRAPQP